MYGLGDSIKEVRYKLPLRCPACRSKVGRSVFSNKTFVHYCINCKWKSKIIAEDVYCKQADLDQMWMRTKNRKA